MPEALAEEIGAKIYGNISGSIRGVSIDTRSLKSGELFFALSGPRYDGNDFARQALERGACGVVVRRRISSPRRGFVLQVENPLQALQKLASFVREKIPLRVIAITGSNGKTSTKNISFQILKGCAPTIASRGNFNNPIGLPLTILRAPAGARWAVLEMGANHPGEIKKLCDIAKPEIGAITNVGLSHLGPFGSLEGVLRTKWELAESIAKRRGTLVWNADDDLLHHAACRFRGRSISFGKSPQADVQAERVDDTPSGTRVWIRAGSKRFRVQTPLLGGGNLYNLLCAVAIAYGTRGVPLRKISGAARRCPGEPGRFEVIRKKDILWIHDAYNANPSSMRASLETLERLWKNSPKILVLGDMLELGKDSARYHFMLGEMAASLHPETIFYLGKMDSFFRKGACGGGFPEENLEFYREHSALARKLKMRLKSGGVVFLKASHGVHLEKILEIMRVRN